MPTISPIIQNGRCVICGKKTNHLNTRGDFNVTYLQIIKHRGTEIRNCESYEECLMNAAVEDWICVPCFVCDKLGN